MALEDALAYRGGATAWVRCAELDRDPGRLLADLVHALARAVPGAADVLGERLIRLRCRSTPGWPRAS